MFTIRTEQLDRLAQARLRDFELRMVNHAKKQYPEETAAIGDDAAVLELIQRTIAHGRTLGIVTERDVAALIGLSVLYGEKFEETAEDPDIAATLRDLEISPKSRLELVLGML